MPSTVMADAFDQECRPVAEVFEQQRQQNSMQPKQPPTPRARRNCGCCNPGCGFANLETNGMHKCRNTLSWAHAPCCIEVKVDSKWVTVVDNEGNSPQYAGKQFPASLLPEDARAAGARNENGNVRDDGNDVGNGVASQKFVWAASPSYLSAAVRWLNARTETQGRT